ILVLGLITRLGSLAMLGWLVVIATVLLIVRRRYRLAVFLVIVATAVLVAAIGFTRLALGVHFLSDVLGAWALGTAWLGITAYAAELWRVEQGRRPSRPLAEGLEPEAAPDLKPTRPVTRSAAVRARWVVAGLVVSWVLVFGALYALGIPLARY